MVIFKNINVNTPILLLSENGFKKLNLKEIKLIIEVHINNEFQSQGSKYFF